MNLFIIGNGFDLAHGMKTSYYDFQKYLENKYNLNIENEEYFTLGCFNFNSHNGKEELDYYTIAKFIYQELGKVERKVEWQNIENNLPKISFTSLLDEEKVILDRDGDIDYWKMANLNEDYSNDYIVFLEIKKFFSDWVGEIELKNVKLKKEFKDLILSNDIFINFNYTMTLEEIYEIKNVYHLHGTQNGDLIFGHGKEYTDEEYNRLLGSYTGAENNIPEIYEALKKPTNEVLERYKDLFKKIKEETKKIYSYGFSFSDVDLVYIKEVCSNLDTKNIEWYLTQYDENEDKNRSFRNLIRSCGFEGEFKLF